MTDDEKHLDLLAIFHFVVAGLTALFACFPLIHVAVGFAMIFGKFDGSNPSPALFGWMFVILGGVFVVCGWSLAVAILVAAMKLKKRVSRTYCIVVGAFECMLMPFGTILGVFTIIILMRETVKQRFAVNQSAHTTA